MCSSDVKETTIYSQRYHLDKYINLKKLFYLKTIVKLNIKKKLNNVIIYTCISYAKNFFFLI